MKVFVTAFFVVLFIAAPALIDGQSPAAWVDVSPGDELFKIQMPQQPRQEQQKNSYGELDVTGRKYTSLTDNASYNLWSLTNLRYPSTQTQDSSDYLDACADLVWESLLKPLRNQLPLRPGVVVAMTIRPELANAPLPGREYQITLGDKTGVTRFYVADARIYVLVVLSRSRGATDSESFFKSFTTMKTPVLPQPATLDADPQLFPPDTRHIPYGAGPGSSTDYNRVFGSREVTERLRILSKPEPQYTESARKYHVTGTVILRAVFSKEGQIGDIKIIKGLPHGLTQKGIAAARQIKFTPAQKDGRPVSTELQLEYNFNLY